MAETRGGRDDGDATVLCRGIDGAVVQSQLELIDPVELAAGLPVREFRSYRGRRHYSGWYWSATGQRLVAYESLLERDRIMLADQAADVVAVAAQPFQLVGHDRGRVRRHVPDVLLLHHDGRVTVVDVKPAGRLSDPRVAAVFAWTDRLLAARGWSFEVWSGAEPNLISNVRFLAGYRRPLAVDPRLEPLVMAAARAGTTDDAMGSVTVAGLLHQLRTHAAAATIRPVVLGLMWNNRLEADLSIPLSDSTIVRVRHGWAGT